MNNQIGLCITIDKKATLMRWLLILTVTKLNPLLPNVPQRERLAKILFLI